MHTTFTDKYKDTLVVSSDPDFYDAEGSVTLEAREGSEQSDLVFDSKTAVEVAHAIFKAAGQEVKPVAEFTPASRVSFNEALLRIAAIHKRTVTFRYAKDKGDYIESRTLNPERVEDDGLSVIGHDPDRSDVRRYRLDRIKGEVAFA